MLANKRLYLGKGGSKLVTKWGVQNLNILHEIAFNTSAITDHDMWKSQISVHKVVALEHNLELGLSYSPFSNVFVHFLTHQQQFQMATRIVLINLGPWESLFNCAYARASQVVDGAPVTPISPCWGVSELKCHIVPEELFQAPFTPVQTHQ